ncbi:MAG: putative ester cyclase [Gammaproteobacteria bacterium]|jgi:predicted ester cyclase
MSNAQIVRDACRIVWTEGQVSRMGEFYADDFKADYPMTNWGRGLEGAKKLAAAIRVGFPDYAERIDELIDAGEDIIVRLTIRGTHTGPLLGLPATGKAVESKDVTICRVNNGKIVE